jgi:zinc protease
MEVQPEDVSRVGKTYLSGRKVQLVVLPQPKHSVSTVGIDRTKTPTPQKQRAFSPPAPVRATLKNGLSILMIEKRGAPMVSFSLLFDTGAIQDPIHLSGLTSFTTGMLQEGTTNRSSSDIAREFDFMGTRLFSGTGRERIQVGTEALSNHWTQALDLIADLLQNPAFPQNEIDRIRTERLTSLKFLQDDAAFSAMQLSPMLVFGKDSPYGHPILGNGKAVESFNRADLINHYKEHFGPKGATLLVVGDITPDEVIKRATASFGNWENKDQVAQQWDSSNTSAVPESALYMLDKPSAAQSVIRLSAVGTMRNNPDYFALVLLNDLFGGQFTSRLNLNLRQDKGYSYGFHSGFDWYRQASLIWAGGAVQSEVTKESIEETLKEFRDIGKTRPVTKTEFKTTKEGILRMFPSGFETSSQILDHLANIAHFKLPDDYYATFTKAIGDVTLSDIHRVAQNWANMQHISLLIVGDLKSVAPHIVNLGLPLITIDYEGNPLD